ncbi:MAG: hypothetical protein ACREJM_10665 [Candidatus Saccharimonadales bacterium]
MSIRAIARAFSFFAVDIFFIYLALCIFFEPAISVLGLIFTVGMTTLGAVIYSKSLSKAMKSKNRRWTMEHFLAPFIGTILTIMVVLPFYAWCLIPLLRSLGPNPSWLGVLAGVLITVIWWISAGVGSVLAISAMRNENLAIRRTSYAGFLVTASTLGFLLAFAV